MIPPENIFMPNPRATGSRSNLNLKNTLVTLKYRKPMYSTTMHSTPTRVTNVLIRDEAPADGMGLFEAARLFFFFIKSRLLLPCPTANHGFTGHMTN